MNNTLTLILLRQFLESMVLPQLAACIALTLLIHLRIMLLYSVQLSVQAISLFKY